MFIGGVYYTFHMDFVLIAWKSRPTSKNLGLITTDRPSQSMGRHQ